jgi:hypothetical protein
MIETSHFLPEPLLLFGMGQTSSDPKEGLFLFGPARDQLNPLRIRAGIVGTPAGLSLYRSWVEQISRAIPSPAGSTINVFYPGFRELFACEWSSTPEIAIPISPNEIFAKLRIETRHEAIHSTVGLFCDAIERAINDEEIRPQIWFVIVPDDVYALGRPRSHVPASERVASEHKMSARLAKRLQREPSLFDDDMKAAEPFFFDLDFHNQLKARLLSCKAVTQVVRESTLGGESQATMSRRRLQDAASVAWNLSVSSFYKADGKPWLLANIRDGVCYIGLVFKHDLSGPTEEYACCGAQMFLSNGDGMVFKARPGAWYSPKTGNFHLSQNDSKEMASEIAEAYKLKVGSYPREIFIHGKTRLDEYEWSGILSGLPPETQAVGIRITRSDEMKLYRPGRMPVIRGTAVVESETLGYLWTSGFVPDLGTYPGWETPNPLRIEICRGTADIQMVLTDVLQLTKLNFNSSIYGDGLPVTLRFADAVGEILTAAPDIPSNPLPFRHYI